MTIPSSPSLRCDGFPIESALLLELLQTVGPGDLSGSGDSVDALQALEVEFHELGLEEESKELRTLHDDYVQLIDAQYKSHGEFHDWSSTWLSLVILGPTSSAPDTFDTVRALTGWKIHHSIQAVDLVVHPGMRGSQVQLVAHLNLNTPARVSASNYSAYREELEPMGIVGTYDRKSEILTIERPAKFTGPQSDDADAVLEGESPKWLVLAIELGIVARLDIQYPTPTRPRTSVERVLRTLFVPRGATSCGATRRLDHVASLVGVPTDHWRCHIMQVGHSQEWATLLFEFANSLSRVYGKFATSGRWTSDQYARVLSRHVSLSPALELCLDEVGRHDGGSVLDPLIAGALFEASGGATKPHSRIAIAKHRPIHFLSRLGDRESIELLVDAASLRLFEMAERLKQSATVGSASCCEQPRVGAIPPKERAKVDFSPVERTGAGSLLASGALDAADAKIAAAKNAYHKLEAEFDLQISQSSKDRDLLTAQLRDLEPRLVFLKSRAVARASTSLFAMGTSLAAGIRLAKGVRTISRQQSRLAFGWCGLDDALSEATEIEKAVSRLVGEVFHAIIDEGKPAERAMLLAALVYFLVATDASNDTAHYEGELGALPLGLMDDLEILVESFSAASPNSSEDRANISSMLESGNGGRPIDVAGAEAAREYVKRIRESLLA